MSRLFTITGDGDEITIAMRDYGAIDTEAQQRAIQDLRIALLSVTTNWAGLFNVHNGDDNLSLDVLVDMEAKIKYQMDTLLDDLKTVKERQKQFI